MADFGMSMVFPSDNETLAALIMGTARLRGEFNVNSVWKASETALNTSQHRATMSFVMCQLTQFLEMEVSRHREGTPGLNEETRVTISPYHNSPRVNSRCSYSTNAGSMTTPFTG
ncbi:hypothetical protein ACFX2I_026459 [Malus domestica]